MEKKQYFCIVFFMVLDLRLMEIGLSGDNPSFFFVEVFPTSIDVLPMFYRYFIDVLSMFTRGFMLVAQGISPIKKSHDKLDKVGKVSLKFVKFANFASANFLAFPSFL